MKSLYTLILCFFFLSIQAQDYYYNGNEKVKVHRSEKDFISYESPSQNLARQFQKAETFSSKGFTILEKKANVSTIELNKENSSQVFPALLLNKGDEFKMYPTRTIRVKLKPNSTRSQLNKILSEKEVSNVREKYGIIRIELKDIHKALKIANEIYESGLAYFSIPDFYTPIAINQVNDPLFPLQFQCNPSATHV